MAGAENHYLPIPETKNAHLYGGDSCGRQICPREWTKKRLSALRFPALLTGRASNMDLSMVESAAIPEKQD